ncbi:MAG TPA: hypothetical protein EYP47_03230 [Methanococcaceae archaeon]|uniref:Uncharacterized protein n=1 Tax=Methanothermococcus okinawensis TaxID=155863 RepID=A0A833E5R6_9EURY|nr:hypothetical protein [Methanococcaceae archaeon]HIP90924.1 hypothetical protein [Methanothermococcus okinawensis]
MRAFIPLILFLLLTLLQSSYAEEDLLEDITIKPVLATDKTICQISGTWKLSFEITNTNPYTVFVAIPDEIVYYDKSLKYYKDFQKLNVSGVVTTYVDDNYTVLNGEKGIWIPPYTTVKVYKDGIFVYSLSTTVYPNRFKVIGPALMDTTSVFDDFQLENTIYKYGVRIGNYKLLVHGKVVKNSNTDELSMIIPAPLVLKNYDTFHKLLGRYDVDMWVDSYTEYIEKHHKMYDDKRKRMVLERTSELHSSSTSPFVPHVDDALIPEMDKDFVDKDLNLRPFDVPAIVFTTKDGEFKPLEFSYVMYKK